jgi:hypothetical protein
MNWRKLGQIFAPDKNFPWMISHAANTVAEHVQGDIFRVYFSCRDAQNKSHIAWADIDINSPFKVVALAQKPLLAPGVTGAFDDSGVSLSCMLTVGGKKFLYYLGWNLGVTVPWRNSIGLAVYNESKKEFERYSTAPLLDRNDVDPFSISYPFVMPDNGLYRMWYGSNLRWGKEQEDMAHIIKYAESGDGIMWKREGKIALNLENENEYAISRPYVIKEKNIYRMWYSFRGKSYRIGYAESADGIDWKRMDEKAGIDVSQNGWDSEMICYPFLFDHKGKRYMLYNGNGYGRTGFGLAVMEN